MIDPVCGMDVEKKTAAGEYQHNGQHYLFCSLHCLERFKADPSKFLSGSQQPQDSSQRSVEGPVYTCPMDPEIRQDNHHSDDVTVLDALSRRELMRIPVGKRPRHVVVASDGRRAYVANSDSNDVSIIDAIGKKVIGRVLVGSNPHGIAAR